MISKYKEQIFSNWNFMRMVRFVLSVVILFQAVQNHDIMFGMLGGIFFTQTILNIGCCGIGGCSVPAKKINSDGIQDVEFVEIKENKK